MPCGLPELRFNAGGGDLDALTRCQLIAVTPCIIAQGEQLLVTAYAEGYTESIMLGDRRGTAVRGILVERGLAPERVQVIVRDRHDAADLTPSSAALERVELRFAPPDPCVLDHDCDGIDLPEDRCPAARELYNGVDDDDGCPDVGPFGVHLDERRRLVFDAPIRFKPRRATLDPASGPLVDALAEVIRSNEQLLTVVIDVYVLRERGKAEALARLADERRVAIEAALRERGVPEGKIPRHSRFASPRDADDGEVVIQTTWAWDLGWSNSFNTVRCDC